MKIKISKNLSHTWLIDLDGTIVRHNYYLSNNKDLFLKGVRVFLKKIPKNDVIIFLTSRKKKYKKSTISFLLKNKVRFNSIIFDLPFGERILMNDIKPKNKLKTAISINLKRDFGLSKFQIINEK
ncbi:hypothetical protein OAN01_00150 [Candidatus Pelagibacter sp.]|nr:hypothetical protein [Candidatus Pelagibacter sp.]